MQCLTRARSPSSDDDTRHLALLPLTLLVCEVVMLMRRLMYRGKQDHKSVHPAAAAAAAQADMSSRLTRKCTLCQSGRNMDILLHFEQAYVDTVIGSLPQHMCAATPYVYVRILRIHACLNQCAMSAADWAACQGVAPSAGLSLNTPAWSNWLVRLSRTRSCCSAAIIS